MKKILSLVLVVAMLLSVAPMTWAADQDVGTATEPKHYASLVLKDSIAINFKSTRAWLEAEGVTKAEFTMGSEVVQTIEGIPAGDSELAVFTFTKLTPAQMAEDVTLSYYAGETLVKTLTSSVLDYCTDACADANENPLLKTALVDMLSYGAAAMVYDNKTVDEALSTALTTYATYATTAEPTLSSKTALTGDAGSVVWLAAGLNLKDSVTLRFKFSAESVEGLTLKLTSNGQTWEITSFEKAADGNYYAYFNGLNPSQLRQLVYGEFYVNSAAVSNKLTYSVESYAAADDGADANLTALTKALMTYGDAVYTWAYTYLAGSDLTYIEAEDVILYQDVDSTLTNDTNTLSSQVVTVTEDENASGGKVAKLVWSGSYTKGETPGETDKPAHLSFMVEPETTGTYYVWVRYAYTNSASIRSYIDGNTYRNYSSTTATGWQYDILGDSDYNSNSVEAENGYVWHRIAVCSWEEGNAYTVRLRGRTGGVSYDKFVITSDNTYAPNLGDSFNSFDVDTIIEAEDTSLNKAYVTIENGAVALDKPVGTSASFRKETGAPGDINFQVMAKTAGVHYIWAKLTDEHDNNGNNFWYSINGSAYAGWWPTVVGWAKIGTYEVTEVGEIINVCLLTRNGANGSSGDYRNKIDQFFVTTENLTTPHEHAYSADWSSDATNHWKACTSTDCTKVTDKGAHVYDDDTDATCNTCGYTREVHIHTYSDAWTTDDTYHWHEATCGCTDLVSDKAEHDFGDTGVCACGKVGFYIVTSGGALYIEAEDMNLFEGYDSTFSNSVYPVTVLNDSDASGGKAVQLGDGTNGQVATGSNTAAYPAHISFKVKAEVGKTYRIFVKAKECTDLGSNILWCYNKEGATDMNWTYLGTDNGTGYNWYSTTLTLEAGEVYTIGFRPRHQYIAIDKICISYNSYSPT